MSRIPSKDLIHEAIERLSQVEYGDERDERVRRTALEVLQSLLNGKLVTLEEHYKRGEKLLEMQRVAKKLEQQLHIAEQNALSIQMQYDKLMVRIHNGELVERKDLTIQADDENPAEKSLSEVYCPKCNSNVCDERRE